MQTHTPRFHEWMIAERDAQAAEREVYALIVQFAKSRAVPPGEDKLLSAREKRARARRLFPDAMQEMKELARSLGHRQIRTTGPARPGIATTRRATDAGGSHQPAPPAD